MKSATRTQYITPDCVADFTTIHLDQAGPDRVRFTGIEGRPATNYYKVSISYTAGFKAIGIAGLHLARRVQEGSCGGSDSAPATGPARLALRRNSHRVSGRERLSRNRRRRTIARNRAALPEVVLRVGVRSENRAAVDRFTREIAPLVLNGPPGVSGLGLGRPRVEEIVAYWPALIPKSEVRPEVAIWPSEKLDRDRARALRR